MGPECRLTHIIQNDEARSLAHLNADYANKYRRRRKISETATEVVVVVVVLWVCFGGSNERTKEGRKEWIIGEAKRGVGAVGC